MESMEWKLALASQEQTEQLAMRIGNEAWPSMVIALDGDLGAGKTTFSKALAKSIGVQEVVSSPTFTIIKEYQSSRLPLYHMDVYRLSLEEADELGLDDYFFGEGITIVEWASLVHELMPQEHLSLFIEYTDEGQRAVQFKAYGQRYIELLQRIKKWSLENE